LPRDDESFLRGVLREVDVTQHGKRASEGHVLEANHEFAKRLASSRRRTTRVRRPEDNAIYVSHVLLLGARLRYEAYLWEGFARKVLSDFFSV
jgi:hypothetical protein